MRSRLVKSEMLNGYQRHLYGYDPRRDCPESLEVVVMVSWFVIDEPHHKSGYPLRDQLQPGRDERDG